MSGKTPYQAVGKPAEFDQETREKRPKISIALDSGW